VRERERKKERVRVERGREKRRRVGGILEGWKVSKWEERKRERERKG
jgi:hypothetical protein